LYCGGSCGGRGTSDPEFDFHIRAFPVCELVVDKNGPRLKESAETFDASAPRDDDDHAAPSLQDAVQQQLG
jgi:hypothetical protein